MAFGQYLGYIWGGVTGIVGGVIGFIYGGPAGAAYGFSIGYSLGSLWGGFIGETFWPEKTDLNFAPPPDPCENRVQISTWGAPIPIQYGSGRMAGNIIYMSDIVETIDRSRHRQDGVRYYEMVKTYTATFAIAFFDGTVQPEGIARIWMNNKVIADFRDPGLYHGGYEGLQSVNLETTIARSLVYFTIYYGSEYQSCDPSLEGLMTASEEPWSDSWGDSWGSCWGTVSPFSTSPAYRGVCYIVFKDFPVGEFSGVPTIEIETGAISHGVWVQRFPLPDNENYIYMSADDDISVIIAIKDAGGSNSLYISTDYGLNWALVGSTKNWRRLYCNRDGTRILAGTYTERLYLSSDYGSSWDELQPAGAVDKSWYCISMNPSGSVILAGHSPDFPGGRFYLSSNYGASFTEVRPLGDANAQWFRCACDDDGSVLVAAAVSKPIYISTDFGATWIATSIGGSGIIPGGVACNADGSVIYIALGDSGRVYRSTDYGVSWQQKNPSGAVDRYWRGGMSCDETGNHVAIAESAGPLYYSTDMGESWDSSNPGTQASPFWNSIKMSADGNNIAIGSYYVNGGIYIIRN